MRKDYIDNIRWMTIVLVVIYHVIYMYNAEGIEGVVGKITNVDVQYWDLYQYAVYPWIMPILFVIAGMCSAYYLENHSDREFLRSRTTKLLVPSTIGLFVFQFLQGYVNDAIATPEGSEQTIPVFFRILIMLASGTGVLWFIQVLWVLSVVLILIRKIEKGKLADICSRTNIIVLVFLGIPVWAAGQVLNTPVIVVYRFGFYGALFLLGYFVFSHEEVIERLKKWRYPLLAAALACVVAFCAVYFGEVFADAPINRSPLFAACTWFGCLAILGCMAKYADFSNRFTRWMHSRCFGLYVFHYLGISSVGLFVAKAGLLPAAACYLLSAFCGFGAGFLLNAIISRIPFFRWAVLGISKRKQKPVTQKS